MELISMTKVRKASAKASESKTYSEEMKKIGDLVLGGLDNPEIHPLLQKNKSTKKLAVILSTDRGLCGNLNSSLFMHFLKWYKENLDTEVLTIGKKGKDFALRAGIKLYANFPAFSKEISVSEITPIANLISKSYLLSEFGEVYIFYMNFLNLATQKPLFIKLLPLKRSDVDANTLNDQGEKASAGFKFEPNPQQIVNYLMPKLFEFQIFRCTLESFASEHAARMIAMKNASDNATDLIDDLTLSFNKARQAQITNEIAEIVAGSMN